MADPQFPPINVPGTGKLYARLHTTQGPIVVELEEQRVPKTVANFVGLATGAMAWKDEHTGKAMDGKPLYEGVRFHRVIPGFMVQCGDPLTRHSDTARRWGTGGPGYRFSDEFHKELKHDKGGVLSMANAGPGTNGSQFFITEKATPWLSGRHTIFGACEPVDLVTKIARVPTGARNMPNEPVTIKKVTITRGAPKKAPGKKAAKAEAPSE